MKDILSTLSAINNVDELLNRIHLMMLKLIKQAENTAISGAAFTIRKGLGHGTLLLDEERL